MSTDNNYQTTQEEPQSIPTTQEQKETHEHHSHEHHSHDHHHEHSSSYSHHHHSHEHHSHEHHSHEHKSSSLFGKKRRHHRDSASIFKSHALRSQKRRRMFGSILFFTGCVLAVIIFIAVWWVYTH
jgi:hypothetical protein